MKGIYFAVIVFAVLIFTRDASAQGTPNGVGNGYQGGQQNGTQNGVGNGYNGGGQNGMQNGASNGTSSRSGNIIIKGSKIGSNAQAGSANGGVWKTATGGRSVRTINIQAVETERDPDRRSISYLNRISTPQTQEIEVEQKQQPRRSKP